jgi:hypothetical protein
MYHDYDEHPIAALIRIIFLGGLFYGFYQKGRQDTIDEIRILSLEEIVYDLRNKLSEQNRINALNRRF